MVRIAHPLSYVLTHLLLEDTPESAVTSVATFTCKFLGCEVAMCIDSLLIETYEMIDAQIVNIGIVSGALPREILTEIEAVCTNRFGKLEKAQVVLQVELFIDAMLL